MMFDSLLPSRSTHSVFVSSTLTTQFSSIALSGLNTLLGRGLLGASDGNMGLRRAMTEVVSNEVKQAVDRFSGRIPFADGQLKLDIPTIIGKIQGTIEFGNGALVSNLSTPLGDYFSSIDFKEQDQIKFQTGQMMGVLNFNDGLVIVDLQPQAPGGEIAFPINALRGAIEVKNGQASVNTEGFGIVAKFDLSALAQKVATNALLGGASQGSVPNSIGAIAGKVDLSALLH